MRILLVLSLTLVSGCSDIVDNTTPTDKFIIGSAIALIALGATKITN